MGSLIDYECKCPNCSLEKMTSDYYYRSDEEFSYCENCGYTCNIIRVLRPGRKPVWCRKVTKPKGGAWLVTYDDGTGTGGGYDKRNQMLARMAWLRRKRIAIRSFIYTYKRRGTWYSVDLVTGKKSLVNTESYVAPEPTAEELADPHYLPF